MAALIALLNVTLLALRLGNVRRLADDRRFEAATTLLGTQSSRNSDSERDDSGHDSFGKVSVLVCWTFR